MGWCANFLPKALPVGQFPVQAIIKRVMRASERFNKSFQQRPHIPHDASCYHECSHLHIVFKEAGSNTVQFATTKSQRECGWEARRPQSTAWQSIKVKSAACRRVMVLNIWSGDSWLPATAIEQSGPLTYLVQVSGGKLWERHVGYIHEMNDSPQQEENTAVHELQLPVLRTRHVEEVQACTPDVKTSEIMWADVQTDTMSSPTSCTTEPTVDDIPVTTPPAVSHPSPTILLTLAVRHQYPLWDPAKHCQFKWQASPIQVTSIANSSDKASLIQVTLWFSEGGV